MLYVVRVVAASGQVLGYLGRGRVVRLENCTIYCAPSAARAANARLAAPGVILLYRVAKQEETMSTKSEIRCVTPRCLADVAKFGEHYHSVHDKADGSALCDRCGGEQLKPGAPWRHVCRNCSSSVEPGQLVGLFVPSVCEPCLEARRADELRRGARCLACGKAYCDCYC